MLAAVIAEKKIEDVVASMKKANADIFELRIDYIKNLSDDGLKRLIESGKKKLIVTNRSKKEGGFYEGKESDRLKLLAAALKFGADYIDVEYSSGKQSINHLIKNKRKGKVIVSYHNFDNTPNGLEKIFTAINRLNPDAIKIVTRANSATDNFRLASLIELAKKENKEIVAFCMGPSGQFSRILNIILGSKITYASLKEGHETADGQLTLDEMQNYRIKKLNKLTKIYGLIGNPVEHSLSHIIHNSGFDEINANAVYLKFKVDKLDSFMRNIKCMDNFHGFSVTIPHKIEIINFVDIIDKKAEKIGAVNTIVKKGRKLIGYNTDCDGAIEAIESYTEIRNKKIVVMGTGGAARAIVYGLKEKGASPFVLSRTVEKAAKFGKELGIGYGKLEELNHHECDILINTTPVGMHPKADESPISAKLIPRKTVVMDIVFNPLKTKLLRDAESKKCTIIDGSGMFLKQAALQFRLWTGKGAPEAKMRRKFVEAIK